MKPTRVPVPRWAWLAYAAGVAGLLVLVVLPAHKYGWMADMDVATDPAALEDGSGNRLIVATLVMLLSVAAQAVWLLRTRRVYGRRHRLAPCVLIVALLLWWGLKF